jgi:hypothetical protein
MLPQPQKAKLTVTTKTHLHDLRRRRGRRRRRRRRTNSAGTYTPPGTFDHETDGKLIDGSWRNLDRRNIYFPLKTCRVGLPHMQRKSEMSLHSASKVKDVFYGKKVMRKFILTVLSVPRG